MSGDTSSPTPNDPVALRVTHERDGDRDLLRVSGELDLLTVPILRKATDELVAQGAPVVLLDMGDVDFMDSSGIALLLELASAAPLRIVTPSAPVRRLIAMAGLESVLPVSS